MSSMIAEPPKYKSRAVFHPAEYNLAELRFLKDSVGKPPAVVFSEALPQGVDAVSVQKVIQTIYEREELSKHRGIPWAGVGAVRDAITTFLEQYAQDLVDHRRGAPRFKSLHQWDARGGHHRAGIGADGKRVQTYIDFDGSRKSFAVDLSEAGGPEAFKPAWLQPEEPLPDGFELDEENGVMICPLCRKSESYNVHSQQSKNMARVRLLKHLKQEREKDPERHRQFYRHVSGG
jgi:hypothetical protein